MRGITKLRLRLRSLFQHGRVERELDEELQYHLDRLTDDHVAAGMTPEDARFAALREMDAIEQRKESCRDARGLALIDSLRQDVRYALRALRKSPGFSTVVILSLALGIGANTAIFSIINSLMLRPLPVQEPAQLVEILTNVPSEPRIIGSVNGFSWKVYEHYRDHNRVFSDVIAVAPARLHVTASGSSGASGNGSGSASGNGFQTESVDGEYVAGNFFSALGVQPAIGRLIDVADDRLGSPDAAVAVVSWSFWNTRFNLDPSIVGRRLMIDDVSTVIMGVTPPTFFGLQVGASPDVWLPASMEPLIQRPSRRVDQSMLMRLMARLKPGVSIEQARAEMRVLDQMRVEDYARTNRSVPWVRQIAITLVPGGAGFSAVRMWFGRPLMGLMAIVGLLLLIACTNVASLLLARGAARQREMAVRVSLGAGRLRLVRQLLTESLVLSLLGCLPGIALAYLGAGALVRLVASGRQPPGLPQRLAIPVQPDLHIILFTVGIAVLTGVLFGLASAWNAFVSAPVSSLREIGEASETRSRRLFGKSLVVAQVAFSVVLLSAAGLFVRHLSNLRNVGVGFQRDSVLLVRLDPTRSGYQPNQLAVLYRQLLDRFSTMPGVRTATLSGLTPIQGPGAARRVFVEGFHDDRPQVRQFVALNWVGPKYFETMGTPLIAGRDFAFEDAGRPPVAIVSQSMARFYFGEANPVGKHFRLEGQDSPYEIVGVAVDAKYADLHEEAPQIIYVHAFQAAGTSLQFALRTSVPPTAIASEVRREVQNVLKTVPIARMTTLAEQVDASIVPERLIAMLSGLFGALGATLAAIGLYGLLAYTVTRRINEFGIRMALGATGRDVTKMVLKSAVTLVCLGLTIGIPIALWSKRYAEQMLNTPPPSETTAAVTLAAIAMIALALIAAYVPARRAARVDPMTALRQD